MDRYSSANKVAILGILANLGLLIIKLLIGFSTLSQSMIADGLNSAGDVFASTITYIGNKISSQPKDEKHPYGHGKAEYIFSMIISFSLLFVAINILESSFHAFTTKQSFYFSPFLPIVAITTIIVKTILYFYCKDIGLKYNNLLVIANAEDHRNDIFVSLSTLLSIILGSFQIFWVDSIVGCGIALWIGYTGIQIFLSAYNVLMDTTIDSALEKNIISNIEANFDDIYHVDSITAKPVGLHFLVIVKISVDGNMKVFDSHRISAEIKHFLMESTNIEDVVVHINPH